MEGVELEIVPEVLNAVAKKAIERETGARGLRSMLEAIMLDIMYHLPEYEGLKKCVITKDFFDKKTDKPELIFEKKAA